MLIFIILIGLVLIICSLAFSLPTKFKYAGILIGTILLLCSCFNLYQNSKKSPTGISDNLKQYIISLTDEESSGSTKNYYIVSGPAQNVTKLKKGQLTNSEDTQNRPSVAQANLTYDMWLNSRGKRQGKPLNPPNGCWVKNKYVAIHYALTNSTYHGYFYNRSHSIADSLAGELSYKSSDNFTAGTRPQNVGADQNGGMRAPEEYVEDYWLSHPYTKATVSYYVTPIYNKFERIPRANVVDVKSSDKKLNKRFVVLNTAENYKINYMNGNFTQN